MAFDELANAAQSWRCGTNEDGVCVIAWYFIAESLRWSLAVLSVSVTMVLLVRLALYAQAAADSFDYGGRMDVRKKGRNLLRVWMSRHRKLLLVGKLIFQIVPSFASCVFFVIRATRREQEGALYAAELTVNVIFAVFFLLRFAAYPSPWTILSPEAIVDVLSFGSFVVMLISTCPWPRPEGNIPAWRVGMDCLPDYTSNTIKARTWFSFSYLRASAFHELQSSACCVRSFVAPSPY